MPNWKKVLTSGSDASLNTLTVTNGITGSLLGTASYASQALSSSFATTASYVLQAVSASFATTSTTQTAGNSTTAVATTAFVTTADNLKANLATPTFTTNITTPLVIGGTAVGSTLTYKTTTGVGTTDAHIFQVGDNGATEAMRITNNGNVGIGTVPTTGYSLHVGKNLTGSASPVGIYNTGQIQSDATTDAVYFQARAATAAGAYVIPNLYHYYFSTSVLGAGSSITNQYGYFASAVTQATNNYGFYGNLSANATRWNIYMNGTAQNYFAGNVGIGNSTPTAVLHLKAGSATANTSPLKFTSGATMSIAEAGSVEFLTDAYYGTITTGAARKTFAFLESPTFTTPALGTPSALVGTNITGTATNFTASTVTTNANLTGVVTSTGNATVIADAALSIAKTSGLQAALDLKAPLASPTLVTPVLGVATATSVTTPSLIGGSAVSSTLTYKTTTGIGTTDAHIFQVGNNGATEAMRILNSGNVGIGTALYPTISSLSVSKNMTGGTAVLGIESEGVIQSDATLMGRYFTSYASTTASVFTVANLMHFSAYQSTIGAGSVVTSQQGFFVDASLTGATNNYGFRGSIASGTNRYNVYMDGTAQNYFAGNVGIGNSTPTAVLHLKAGSATANTSPLKFTSGTLLTTAEAGSVEFLTDAYYGTITTGAARKTFAFLESPTFTTPTLGVATATSVNKVTITAPATSATLTLVNGGSLITAGAFSTTLTSTAATNVTLPLTGTLATLAGSETLTNKTLATGTIAVTQASNTNNTTIATTAYADANQIFTASLSITSAQIKSLFSSPLTIVSAPAAGKYIDVISAVAEMTYITAPYATNTTLMLIMDTSTNEIMTNSAVLTATTDIFYKFTPVTFGSQTTAHQIQTVKALQVKVQTGNPIAGAGTLKVKVLYRIVTV